jgi:nucleoside-diphosphate-sugar epimerase
MKNVLVLGAGGFIGNHMVTRLKDLGYWVRGVDIHEPKYSKSKADEFVYGDLTDFSLMKRVVAFTGTAGNFYSSIAEKFHDSFDEIYNFAADMGGAEYVFSGNNDANIMSNSALININLVKAQNELNLKINKNKTVLFYASSACVYPEDSESYNYSESMAYPANPDSEYGWEKLFAERLYMASEKNYGIPIRIARFHNVYGPLGTFYGGKEKAPAALCRKVAKSSQRDTIQIIGNGEQTRSFLYIDDCIDGVQLLMESTFNWPINIGSDFSVSINFLADQIIKISGKNIVKEYVDGPVGVLNRNSNSSLAKVVLGWEPKVPLNEGLFRTYKWINSVIQEID